MRSLATYLSVPHEYLALLAEVDLMDRPSRASAPQGTRPDPKASGLPAPASQGGGASGRGLGPRTLRPA